jgi:hypothetical protein
MTAAAKRSMSNAASFVEVSKLIARDRTFLSMIRQKLPPVLQGLFDQTIHGIAIKALNGEPAEYIFSAQHFLNLR